MKEFLYKNSPWILVTVPIIADALYTHSFMLTLITVSAVVCLFTSVSVYRDLYGEKWPRHFTHWPSLGVFGPLLNILYIACLTFVSLFGLYFTRTTCDPIGYGLDRDIDIFTFRSVPWPTPPHCYSDPEGMQKKIDQLVARKQNIDSNERYHHEIERNKRRAAEISLYYPNLTYEQMLDNARQGKRLVTIIHKKTGEKLVHMDAQGAATLIDNTTSAKDLPPLPPGFVFDDDVFDTVVDQHDVNSRTQNQSDIPPGFRIVE
jgi:hypothetical protein